MPSHFFRWILWTATPPATQQSCPSSPGRVWHLGLVPKPRHLSRDLVHGQHVRPVAAAAAAAVSAAGKSLRQPECDHGEGAHRIYGSDGLQGEEAQPIWDGKCMRDSTTVCVPVWQKRGEHLCR